MPACGGLAYPLFLSFSVSCIEEKGLFNLLFLSFSFHDQKKGDFISPLIELVSINRCLYFESSVFALHYCLLIVSSFGVFFFYFLFFL